MILDWPGCRNARDLGGLRTEDGGTLRPRALVRTDGLHRLDGPGLQALRDYGVSRVVDLRTEQEAARRGSAVAGTSLHLLRPLVDPGRQADALPGADADPSADDDPGWPESLEAMYRSVVDTFPDLVAAAAAAVADAPPGAVVVHCHAGKDRTGILVALLLRAVGVRWDDVLADYVLSDAHLVQHYAEELDELPAPHLRERLRRLQHCDPAVLSGVLERVERTYGDAAGYLRAGGLSAEALDRLRTRLLG